MDPITRQEQYLNAIAGGDNDVPATPQTREEWFLNQILENGGGGDPETIKEAVEEWLDEHIDPTTGYAVDDTLSIAGAAADAKAAGDELADVKSALSVEGIVDIYTDTVTEGAYINQSGTVVSNTGSAYSDYLPVTARGYTIKYDSSTVPSAYNLRIHGYDSTKAWVSQIYAVEIPKNTSGTVSKEFTVPSGIAFIRVSFYLYDTVSNCHVLAYGSPMLADALAQANAAREYNPITEYSIGDYCVKGGWIYKALSTTTGVWDKTAWEQVILADAIKNIENSLIGKTMTISQNKITENYRLTDTGKWVYTLNYTAAEYIVTPGDLLEIVSDDTFQFQNSTLLATTDAEIGLYRIGNTYGAGTFRVVVPQGASYLKMSTPATGSDIACSRIIDISEEMGELEHTVASIVTENLFDGTVVDGYYISGDGTIKSHAGSAYSALIPVQPGEYGVSFEVTTSAGVEWYARVMGYDGQGEWDSIIASEIVGGPQTGTVDILATVPEGIEYISVSLYRYDCVKGLIVKVFDGDYKISAIDTAARARIDEISQFIQSPIPKRVSPLKSWGAQPAADGSEGSFCNMSQGYEQLLEDVYEPLRTAYPNYITRQNVGKDASGTYDMYVYTFAPRYYQQSILLVAGIHANEPDAIACLARIMQLICTEYQNDEDLKFIRQNVKITVIPCVNVWGFSQSPKQRKNVDDISIQTWDAASPIAEIANLKPVIIDLKDELSFMVDMHTTTNNDYLDFYGVINVHDKNVRTLFRTNSWLCEQYALNGGTVDDQWFGYIDNMPGLMSNYFFNEYGMTTSTLELSDYRWDSAKSTSTVITMGVTMWLNYIVQQINDFYKTMHDIPNSDYRPSKA